MKFLVMALWLVVALQGVSQSDQRTKLSAPGDLDIYESVIRYQIQTWDLRASTYCIRVNGRNADEAILNRLRPLPVKAASACKELKVSGIPIGFVDKKTKKNTVIFDVENIRRVSDSEVEVEGGYLCGSLCMAGGTYHVVREGAGWRVTDFRVEIMA